jgi:hypothetical protein
MIFFSGFCFKEEEELFQTFTCKGEFCVAGFSYGAIKALKYALHVKSRLDKIQLISPAFFQDKDEKFKRMQKISFQKNPQKYFQNFIKNVQFPSPKNLEKFLHVGTFNELEELLDYEYKQEELAFLKNKNIKIEVYLGEKDKIIDAKKTKEFFLPFATVYLFKDAGHLLQIAHD